MPGNGLLSILAVAVEFAPLLPRWQVAGLRRVWAGAMG